MECGRATSPNPAGCTQPGHSEQANEGGLWRQWSSGGVAQCLSSTLSMCKMGWILAHTHTPKKIVGRFAGRKGALRPEAEVDEANRFFQLDLV